ncbi:MAG: hypothetical protein ACOCRK_10855 [bacterium]
MYKIYLGFLKYHDNEITKLKQKYPIIKEYHPSYHRGNSLCLYILTKNLNKFKKYLINKIGNHCIIVSNGLNSWYIIDEVDLGY